MALLSARYTFVRTDNFASTKKLVVFITIEAPNIRKADLVLIV